MAECAGVSGRSYYALDRDWTRRDVSAKVKPSFASCGLGGMPNERLRALLLERRVTTAKLAEAVEVDAKTVERWIVAGRVPYRRHRYNVAAFFGVDESYIWPDALDRDQVTAASESEIVAVYPYRRAVPRDTWGHLFGQAEQRDRHPCVRVLVPGRGRRRTAD